MLVTIALVAAISASADGESAAMRAKLAELAGVDTPFDFAVISDNRAGDRVYKKLIKEMMRRKPLFVVNVGDVIPNPGNRDHWKHFWDISREITVPLFIAPGNHDIDDEESMKVWMDEVDFPGNKAFYSFTVGKNLFVVLDSSDPKEWRRIVGPQFKWLAKTLDPERYEHQFVFVHHPLFMWKGATHEHEALDDHPVDRDRLHALFAAKRVDIVFSGHEHLYRRDKKDGVNYIIAGGGGSPLYGGKEEFNHFMFLRVDGALVEAKTIDRDNVLRDEFFVLKNGKDEARN